MGRRVGVTKTITTRRQNVVRLFGTRPGRPRAPGLSGGLPPSPLAESLLLSPRTVSCPASSCQHPLCAEILRHRRFLPHPHRTSAGAWRGAVLVSQRPPARPSGLPQALSPCGWRTASSKSAARRRCTVSWGRWGHAATLGSHWCCRTCSVAQKVASARTVFIIIL